jgi:hypothetical protein
MKPTQGMMETACAVLQWYRDQARKAGRRADAQCYADAQAKLMSECETTKK